VKTSRNQVLGIILLGFIVLVLLMARYWAHF